MDFDEFIRSNPVANLLCDYEVENMRVAWNKSREVTIDEAVKAVSEHVTLSLSVLMSLKVK